MVSRYSAYRRGSDTIPPDVIDRILLGACAAIWLVLLGVSVAATVALADLGRGFRKAAGNPHTTWVLYAVIIVSALIIAAAIPVLLRARRAAAAEPVAPVAGRPLVGAGSAAPRSAADRIRQQQRPQAPGQVFGTVAGVVRRGGGPSLVARHDLTDGHDGGRTDRGRCRDLPDGRRS